MEPENKNHFHPVSEEPTSDAKERYLAGISHLFEVPQTAEGKRRCISIYLTESQKELFLKKCSELHRKPQDVIRQLIDDFLSD